jgi:hypothetical protein
VVADLSGESSKEDVHRPEEIWPALLHQRDLSGGSSGA